MFFFTVFFPFLHFFQSQRKQSLASDSEKEHAARTEWGQAQQITNYKHLHWHNVPLSPECLKCFDMHLTAHASVKCPFSKSNILHVPLLTHLLAAAIQYISKSATIAVAVWMLRGGRFAYETAGCRWSLLGAQTALPKGSKRRGCWGRAAELHARRVGYLHFKQHRLKEERVQGRKKKNRERHGLKES